MLGGGALLRAAKSADGAFGIVVALRKLQKTSFGSDDIGWGAVSDGVDSPRRSDDALVVDLFSSERDDFGLFAFAC